MIRYSKPLFAILPALLISLPTVLTAAESSGARRAVVADLKKLVAVAQHPENAAITRLSRQFGFNYTAGACDENPDPWCNFLPRYQGRPAAQFSMIYLGEDRSSGMPVGKLSWDIVDRHVCLTVSEVERFLGRGKPWFGSVNDVFGGASEKLPVLEEFHYEHIPGVSRKLPTAAGVIAEFQNKCLSGIRISVHPRQGSTP